MLLLQYEMRNDVLERPGFLTCAYCHVFIVGFLLCPSQLNVAGASDLWKQALQDGFVIPLVRDEVFFIYSAFESVLNNSKDKKYVLNVMCMLFIVT